MPAGAINPLDIAKDALQSIIGSSIGPDDKIVVPHFGYFKKLQILLAQINDYDIVNYLIWREIIQMAKFTTNSARETMEAFHNVIEGE